MTEYPALRQEPRNEPTPPGPPGNHFSFLEWLRQEGRLIEWEPYYDESDEERPIETLDNYLEPDDSDGIDPDFDDNEEVVDPPHTDVSDFDQDDSAETDEPSRQGSETSSIDKQEHDQNNQRDQENEPQTPEPTRQIPENESTDLGNRPNLVPSSIDDTHKDYVEDPEFMTEEVKAQITRIDQNLAQLVEWSSQHKLVDQEEEGKEENDLKPLIFKIEQKMSEIQASGRSISTSLRRVDKKLDDNQYEVLDDIRVKCRDLKLIIPEEFRDKAKLHLSSILYEDLLPSIRTQLSDILENSEGDVDEKTLQIKMSLKEVLEEFENRKDKVIDYYIEALQARNQELEQENETVKTLRNIISEQKIESNGLLAEKERLLEQLAALEEERKKLRQDYSHSITEASDLRQQIQELQDTHQQDLQNAQSEKLRLLQDSEAQIRELGRQHQQALDKAQVDRQELTADLDTYQRLVTEREQQLQLLRESLTTSLTQLTERLDNPETGAPNNSPESTSSDSFADLRQSLLVINNSLQAIPSISAALVAQIKHAEEQLTLQNQHLQDLTQSRDALQAERDSARAELATSQETLSAQVAEKSQLTGKLQALEAQYAELERAHHQSISEQGKLQERMAHLERSEQAQRKAQQQCADQLSETQQQLEEEREKRKLFGFLNRSKANTPKDS